MLRRPRRGALASALGRSAPRPHRFRRMAPALQAKSLIQHRGTPRGSQQVPATSRKLSDSESRVIDSAMACSTTVPERNTMKNPRSYFRAYLAALLMLAVVPAEAADVKELFAIDL